MWGRSDVFLHHLKIFLLVTTLLGSSKWYEVIDCLIILYALLKKRIKLGDRQACIKILVFWLHLLIYCHKLLMEFLAYENCEDHEDNEDSISRPITAVKCQWIDDGSSDEDETDGAKDQSSVATSISKSTDIPSAVDAFASITEKPKYLSAINTEFSLPVIAPKNIDVEKSDQNVAKCKAIEKPSKVTAAMATLGEQKNLSSKEVSILKVKWESKDIQK